jgi:hypothetical protein
MVESYGTSLLVTKHLITYRVARQSYESVKNLISSLKCRFQFRYSCVLTIACSQ